MKKTKNTEIIDNIVDAEFEEINTRELAIISLEGKMPYERAIYLAETKKFLAIGEYSFKEAGKMFLVMKEREPHGEFMNIIEEHFPHYSHRTVNDLMRIALVLEQNPRISTKITDSNMPKSSVLELCKAPEEDLKELEAKGILAGRDMDEIARMSVKELREFARKLNNDLDKEVKDAVKQKLSEKNAVIEGQREQIKKLETLTKGLKKDTPEAIVEKLKVVRELSEKLHTIVNELVFTDEIFTEDVNAAVLGTAGTLAIFASKFEDLAQHVANNFLEISED